MRFGIGPTPQRTWRRKVEEVAKDEAFITAVMMLWDRGLDTATIADKTFECEAAVARALHIGRERRRRDDNAT